MELTVQEWSNFAHSCFFNPFNKMIYVDGWAGTECPKGFKND